MDGVEIVLSIKIPRDFLAEDLTLREIAIQMAEDIANDFAEVEPEVEVVEVNDLWL